MPTQRRLFTFRFALVVAAGLAYFLALGMLLPVVPRYVTDRLGGGSVAVGVAVGALFVGAVLLRPYAGRLGDRIGRRPLIVGGALIVAATAAVHGVVASLPFLVGVRLLAGIGEAAFFVGAAAMATDLAPVERRGEAVSYWSIAVYGGLGLGPAIGELVLRADSYTAVWLVSAALALAAACLGLATVETRTEVATGPQGPLLHRAALGPGAVLGLGLVGLAGFLAFLPLYSDDLGLGGARGIFLLYGGLILAVRIFGARLPDVLGGRRAGSLALMFAALGLAVIASWGTVAGLVAGTVVFAAGMSLMYPALLVLALDGIPETQRASVVGTFSAFFDLSQGAGALLVGVVAALTGYRGGFAAGAVCALLGVVLLRGGLASRGRVLAPEPA